MSSTIGTIDMEDVDTQQQGKKEEHKVSSPESTTPSHENRMKKIEVEALEASKALAGRSYLTSDSYFSLLAHIKADKFAIEGKPEETPIWICNREDKINDVLNGMIKRNILSVPVLLKSQKYYGFLDMLDIVKYVVSHFGSSEFQSEKNFFTLLKEEKEFNKKTVGDLMEAPSMTRNLYHPVHSGYSAFAVVEALARESGLHRVPVISKDRQMINLVTQSQVVRFLFHHVNTLGTIKDSKVKDFKHLFHEVLAVKEDSLAIDGFNLMAQNDVQGIAVVNADGRLKGNLSLRDLKVVGADMNLFWRLHQTVKNFILKLRQEYQTRHGRPRSIVYIVPETPIKDVIHALVEHSVHRLYICNDHKEKQLVGVLTLQDLLALILDH